MLLNFVPKGAYPGAETQDIPDEDDEVDAGDVVEELGVDSLATGCRVRRVGRRFLHADEQM
jgi:hypothetical protein